MNKYFLSFIIVLVASGRPVFATDVLTVSDSWAIPGMNAKEIAITLNNEQTYSSFQFDLYLPEGIIINSFTAEKRLPTQTNLQMNQQKDGSYRFIAVTSDLKKSISGNSGSLIKLSVSISENCQRGSLQGYFKNVKLSDANGEGNTYSEIPFSFIVSTIGDVNSDGFINVADAVEMANYILQKPSNNFRKEFSDLNGDSIINVADIVKLVLSIP